MKMNAAVALSAIMLFPRLAWSKDTVQVQVVATHAVTHEDRGARATVDKGILGANVPTKSVESFNLDAIVNGEHVLLACDDPKGCESPAVGTYEGELKRSKWIKLKFPVPISHKEVSRWYKISGSW